MITRETQPLDIAAQILKPETIQSVKRSPSYHYHGWKILDRWAFNSPEKLLAMEAEGEILLLIRLLEQQDLEFEILMDLKSSEQRRNGLTEYEILAMHEINTEL